MTLANARRIVLIAAKGHPHDEDLPTGDILRAVCVLLAHMERS